jgi:hypothetical protein
MIKILFVALALLGHDRLCATEQMPDFLTLEGKRGEVLMSGSYLSPFERYFARHRRAYPLEEAHTGNHRGHIAEWKFEEKKLYLVSLMVEGENQGELDRAFDLKRLFPKADSMKGVFAEWFTGMLLLQEGKHRVDLEGGNYTIKYKKYRILSIKNGVLTRSATLDPDAYWDAVKEVHSDDPPEPLSPNGALLRAYYDDQLDSGINWAQQGVGGHPATKPRVRD